MTQTVKALSIKQPWAWLIVNGHKDIENRDWPTGFRGKVLIHASKSWDKSDVESPIIQDNLGFGALVDLEMEIADGSLGLGGIVGIATITRCVSKSNSPWFVGDYGFVIEDARPVSFIPCRGQLGLWDVPQEVLDQLPTDVLAELQGVRA